jgi:hypothetical protein
MTVLAEFLQPRGKVRIGWATSIEERGHGDVAQRRRQRSDDDAGRLRWLRCDEDLLSLRTRWINACGRRGTAVPEDKGK